jgi:hypothetical protein
LKFKDGDIFKHHVDAEARDDEKSAKDWLAMLSPRKQRTVHELKTFDGGKFLTSLKQLLPFAGLWSDFKLGSATRVLPMRCREVCVIKGQSREIPADSV